jgi:AraC family transcriptional regulator
MKSKILIELMLYFTQEREEVMTNYLDCFQRAVEYIETHLTEPITFETISNTAYLSGFYFSRVFHLYLGETLSSYVRKRRLTEAADDLIHTELPILEIALKFQFESQEAFTRSFKRQFHLTPAKYRKYR